MVLSKHLHRLREDQRGTVSIIMGLLIVPLVGALGIGFEVSNWYMNGRGMQNAADAAALAAATNGGANYDVEAKAVAAQYGFVDGANNITVAASNKHGGGGQANRQASRSLHVGAGLERRRAGYPHQRVAGRQHERL